MTRVNFLRNTDEHRILWKFCERLKLVSQSSLSRLNYKLYPWAKYKYSTIYIPNRYPPIIK